MKINIVQNTNFESNIPKRKFITKEMRNSLESILLKMNRETSTIQDGDYFKHTITTKLHFKNNVTFEDERRLTKRVPFEEQMQGFSNLKIGKKTVLDIDNETGEIIDYKKPFYKPLFWVLRKAENILCDLRTNFNLAPAVEKERLTIQKLTPEGQTKMKKYVLQIEKERLEKIVKNLEDVDNG